MSQNFLKSQEYGINDIQWHLLDDGVNKLGKASGIKIEHSMSNEIDFAQKLSIALRKKLMRELLHNENAKYQEELNCIGRLHSRDTVCEDVRKCGRDQSKTKTNFFKNAQESHLTKLFKIYDN